MKTNYLSPRAGHLASTFALLAGLLAAGLLCTSSASADSLNLRLIVQDTQGLNHDLTQSSPGTPLSDSASSSWVNAIISQVLTGVQVDCTAVQQVNYDPNGNFISIDAGSASFSAMTSDTFTIVTDPALDGTTGTIRFDYHISGSFLPTNNNGNNSDYVFADPAYVSHTTDHAFAAGYLNGQLLPDTLPASRTGSVNITLSSAGTAITLPSNVGGGVVSDATSAHVTQRTVSTLTLGVGLGTVELLDANGNFLSYNSSSGAGTGRGQNVPGGNSYTSFNLVNNVGYQSTLTLRDGTASTARYVRAAFVAPPLPSSGLTAVSDVADFSGTQSDLIVIQTSYDPAAAIAIFGSESNLGLVWFDPVSQVWQNAVTGNTGGTPTFVNGPYNPAADFHLGYFGLDTPNHVVWAVLNHNSQFAVTNLPSLQVPTVVSRKVHGSAGTFDIPLPLGGGHGIECRTGGANEDYQVVFNFPHPVTLSAGASVTSGTGTVSNTTVNGGVVTVDLTGITNAQVITITLNGSNSGPVSVRMGVLVGDTNGNGTVSASDVAQTKAQSGNATVAGNFREDVNASGSINAGDVALVKSKTGTVLPP